MGVGFAGDLYTLCTEYTCVSRDGSRLGLSTGCVVDAISSYLQSNVCISGWYTPCLHRGVDGEEKRKRRERKRVRKREIDPTPVSNILITPLQVSGPLHRPIGRHPLWIRLVFWISLAHVLGGGCGSAAVWCSSAAGATLLCLCWCIACYTLRYGFLWSIQDCRMCNP